MPIKKQEPPAQLPKNQKLQEELTSALSKVKEGANLSLNEIDELQLTLTEFRIDIFKNDVKDTAEGAVLDDDYQDKEF